MKASCDLCHEDTLTLAYEPPTTARGLAIYVCQMCGLVQSLPRIDHVPERRLAVSSGADWGNLRYGKGFRTERAIELLGATVTWDTVRHALDVGANRGSFVLRLRELAPAAHIRAIEPDATVVAPYADLPGIELSVGRLEHTALPANTYDLIYLSHTLEHLASPRLALDQLAQASAPGGVLFVEVPRLEFIGASDVVEEWFLDKHLYHFSRNPLEAYLQRAGFQVIEAGSYDDAENITLVARRLGEPEPVAVVNRGLAKASSRLIERYRATLTQNQEALQTAARRLESLAANERLAVWGAGRIFDSLVQYGELDVRCLVGVVDKYLGELTPQVHGCAVLPPEALPALQPQTVLIASREYFAEISDQLGALVPGCRALGWQDVLAEAAA